MSYILDALQKKENEGKNSDVPDIASQHHYSPFEDEAKSNSITWLLLGIISLLLLGLAYSFFFKSTYSNEALRNEPSSQKVIQPAAEDLSLKNVSQLDNKVQPAEILLNDDILSKEAIALKDSTAQAEVTIKKIPLEKTALVLEKIEPAKKAVATSLPIETTKPRIATAESQEEVASDENLKNDYLQEESLILSKDVSQPEKGENSELPKIIYTTHVYASKQKDRFVMLNGKAYSVGGKLSRNFWVKDILENDLLLSFKGKDYLVPALTDVNP